MSDLHVVYLSGDYRDRLVAIFPRVTAAQLMRFDDLVRSDRLVTDDLAPHPEFQAWVAGVMRRGDEPDPVPVAGSPLIPSPAGAALEALLS
jgi:hypothetical protein